MILSLRGTHGSGKSTVVKAILDRYQTLPQGEGKRPEGYRVDVPYLRRPLYVVGPYTTACGGCDAVQPYDLIWPRVASYHELGHVLFEGALVSSSYGNIGRASEPLGDGFVFAFLDTPLEVCLARIVARRRARGDDRPVNPDNTRHKYESIQKSIPKIREEFGRRVVLIDHRRAVGHTLRLLLEGDREEAAGRPGDGVQVRPGAAAHPGP